MGDNKPCIFDRGEALTAGHLEYTLQTQGWLHMKKNQREILVEKSPIQSPQMLKKHFIKFNNHV